MARITSRFAFQLVRVIALLLTCSATFTYASSGQSNTAVLQTDACSVPTVDGSPDIKSLKYFMASIRELLSEERFAGLDCIADGARTSKARFASGGWKLNVFYLAIVEPQGHATNEDWAAHLATLDRWVSARPKSVTARVAMADAYTSYAWNARGSGLADTVTPNGWKLFSERIDRAKEILQEASKLDAKCPHWYEVMQTVALAESWDLTRATQLLYQAIRFEPDYQYFYRNHANYLEPQWNGAEGDAEAFAEAAADRVSGEKGDVLYFQIATQLICGCRVEERLKRLSWPRIQNGVAALEKQYGPSLINLNLLAYMATKKNDAIVAKKAFDRIGDNWSESEWKTEESFEHSRMWAHNVAADLGTPGLRIRQQGQEKFAASIHQCVASAPEDPSKFTLLVRLQKDGLVDSVMALPPTKAGLCLMKLAGETLSPPPYSPFTFQLDVDPTQLVSASAH